MLIQTRVIEFLNFRIFFSGNISPISSSSRKRSDKKEDLIKKGWEQKRQSWYKANIIRQDIGQLAS